MGLVFSMFCGESVNVALYRDDTTDSHLIVMRTFLMLLHRMFIRMKFILSLITTSLSPHLHSDPQALNDFLHGTNEVRTKLEQDLFHWHTVV